MPAGLDLLNSICMFSFALRLLVSFSYFLAYFLLCVVVI